MEKSFTSRKVLKWLLMTDTRETGPVTWLDLLLPGSVPFFFPEALKTEAGPGCGCFIWKVIPGPKSQTAGGMRPARRTRRGEGVLVRLLP